MHGLLSDAAELARAAGGLLSEAEQRAISRPARPGPARWSAADLVLIDEADAVLGGRPRRFGHLVVDEAQDVSAMGWRMLGRRCARTMSMTVLGVATLMILAYAGMQVVSVFTDTGGAPLVVAGNTPAKQAPAPTAETRASQSSKP